MQSTLYPHIVTKNTSHKLFVKFDVGASSSPNPSDISSTTIAAYICKDGGVWTLATNPVVIVPKNDTLSTKTRGVASLVLTADELNADDIVVSFQIKTGTPDSNTESPTIIIKTGTPTTGGSTPTQCGFSCFLNALKNCGTPTA